MTLKKRVMSAAIGLAAITAAAVPAASAQDCHWTPLGVGLDDTVRSLVVFDDGTGPALYAGGHFTTAGGVTVNNIAKWDGDAWSALGSGMGGGSGFPWVNALAVFDDGSGPALYAGGQFTTAGGSAIDRVARWDGASWTALGSGTNNPVYALTVLDDGTGPALYAGGRFTTAGGEPANRVAKWDGAAWSPLATGFDDLNVFTLAGFDDGSGMALYAGGNFTTAGGQPVNRIAKWDGDTWLPLGAGVSADAFPAQVYGIAGFDDGSGPMLHVSGNFSHAGGAPADGIARWAGESWSPIVPGMVGIVRALMVFDDGAGDALYVGGFYLTASGPLVEHIGKWDGSAWWPLAPNPDAMVWSLGAFDDGGGPALYAGGAFITSGPAAVNHIARWSCPPAHCYADCDSSASLDFFDFLCFQNLFAAADPRADCDQSGAHDFFDFLCFQNAFAAGCP